MSKELVPYIVTTRALIACADLQDKANILSALAPYCKIGREMSLSHMGTLTDWLSSEYPAGRVAIPFNKCATHIYELVGFLRTIGIAVYAIDATEASRYLKRLSKYTPDITEVGTAYGREKDDTDIQSTFTTLVQLLGECSGGLDNVLLIVNEATEKRY